MDCARSQMGSDQDPDMIENFLNYLLTFNLSKLTSVLTTLKKKGVITSVRSLTLLDPPTLQELEKKFPSEDNPVQLSEVLILFHHIDDYIREFSLASLLEQKLFNDPVHGNVHLHPIAVRIVDTPQFQRLRHIKQVACLNRVFPGGDHTRFEHSIGTYHLAGKLINLLKEKQPELHISPLDALCVQLAGLCHDLGHGPFSHLFDVTFIPAVAKRSSEERKTTLNSWRHEDASQEMFDHLLDDNGLRAELTRWGLSERDTNFIKEMISGKRVEGRGIEKAFLYEIVCNNRNGLDVDKWDYIARDCLHLGIKAGFEHDRLMHMIRVMEVNGELQLCVKQKETATLYDLFATRYNLHRKAYKHRVSVVIELMITEALRLADRYLLFTGEDGKQVCLSECIHDMVAYTKLTDHLYTHILWSEKEELRPARELLLRIEQRKLWVCIGEARPAAVFLAEKSVRVEDIEEGIWKNYDSETSRICGSCNQRCTTKEDICAAVTTMDYGRGEKNPVENMSFYTKENRIVPYDALKFSWVLPTHFRDRKVLVFCKSECAAARDVARKAFTEWCRISDLQELD